MNQENVGHFIAELRKEKNMTQQELADKLCVTDRAVSHWENGRRLPDISLLKMFSVHLKPPFCLSTLSIYEIRSTQRKIKQWNYRNQLHN